MDKFFTENGVVLAVAQDCSIIEFASIQQALESSPICALQARVTYENMLVRGLIERWYQNTKYDIYSIGHSVVQSLKIGKWQIRNLYLPRGADTLHCDFVDPIGKILHQEIKEIRGYRALSQAFRNIREMNNYESVLNYQLMKENEQLRNELTKLRKGK